MAKGNNLLLQGLSGKIGGLIITRSSDGDSIIRSRPSTIRQPNSLAQKTQKQKFGEVVELARLNKQVIRAYTKPKKQGVSAYSTFIGRNVKEATGSIQGGSTLLYEKIKTVTGGGADVYGLVISAQESTINPNQDEIDLSWTYDIENPTHNVNDKVGLILIDKATGVIKVKVLPEDMMAEMTTKIIERPEGGERVIIPFVFFGEEKRGTESKNYVLQLPSGGPRVENR